MYTTAYPLAAIAIGDWSSTFLILWGMWIVMLIVAYVATRKHTAAHVPTVTPGEEWAAEAGAILETPEWRALAGPSTVRWD